MSEIVALSSLLSLSLASTLPTATNTVTSSVVSPSTSTQSRSSSSQTPSPSSTFIHAARVHPSDTSVMIPPYSANPNSRAEENHIPLNQYMQLITLVSNGCRLFSYIRLYYLQNYCLDWKVPYSKRLFSYSRRILD